MNLLQRSIKERRDATVSVRPAFNWIETFAVPVSTNIMETQPLVLFLAFVAFMGQGAGTPLPVGEVGITLLLLGLQWWCMFINYRVSRGLSGKTANILSVSGIIVAYGLALITNIATLSLPSALVILVVVIFCWKRAVDKAKAGLNDDQLILTFKLGLLFVLVISALLLATELTPIPEILDYALPLFFLSGLIGLSFTRLGVIRREQERQGASQIDPTRSWLIALTLLWGLMVAGAVALETFSFEAIQALLLPIWQFLGLLVSWILYAVIWLILIIPRLIESLFHSKLAPVQMPSLPVISNNKTLLHNGVFPIWPLLVGRIALIVTLLVVLFLIVRAVLRQARPSLSIDGEEEIREALSVRAVLWERRQEHRKQEQEVIALEPLDPGSARARYRDLLQKMARVHMERQPEETPVEYQKRLGAFIERTASETFLRKDILADRAMLDEVTRAYASERYGGERAEIGQHDDVRMWIEQLSDRLSGPGR